MDMSGMDMSVPATLAATPAAAQAAARSGWTRFGARLLTALAVELGVIAGLGLLFGYRRRFDVG